MPKDVISLIMADHREVEQLFDRLRSNTADRSRLAEELGMLLIAHSASEEECVYPVIAQQAPGEREQVGHSEEEHHQAEELVRQLQDTPPDDEAYDSILHELVEAVTTHVETEESEVLPALRDAVSKERLAELGEEFDRRRREVMAGAAGGEDVGRLSRKELYEEARQEGVRGRSKMGKDELAREVREERSDGR